MAEAVHLFLRANGAAIQGESTVTTLGREHSIQCYSFDFSMAAATDAASGLTIGKRQYAPIRIRKRIDKSTPLLMKALAENQVIEAQFMFYRPNPAGDGTIEQFYTIEIKLARITSLRNFVSDVLVPDTARFPPLEELTFVFNSIRCIYTKGGIEFGEKLTVQK